MGIKFLQNIDAERNKFEEAGFEVVNALPTTNLFIGRQVTYDGRLYVYNGSKWMNITAPYEADLQWGGRNIESGFSPIDASLNDYLRANRFALYNDIVLEYSTDGGNNWLEYANDDKLYGTYTTSTPLLNISRYIDRQDVTTQCQLRATFKSNSSIYTVLNKFMLYVSTNGCSACWVTLSVVNQDDTITTLISKQPISGWAYWNVLNLKSNIRIGDQSSCVKSVIFTFGYDGTYSTTSNGLTIYSIFAYGSPCYFAYSNIKNNGTIYKLYPDGSVVFPAAVKSTETVNFDANIKPTQTGKVAKTSNWLWQYYAQSIAWLMANHLPLAGGKMTGNLTVPKLIKSGGTATQMLMADGSTKDISGFASSDDIPTQLPNPNPITIKTADGVSVRYDGSTSGGVILEAGDNAELTATQDSDDTMTVKFDAVVPTKLPNPQNLIIQVVDDIGAALGTSISYNGSEYKTLILASGNGIELTDSEFAIGQVVRINLKQIAGTTLLGNVNGTTGTPQAITMAQLRTMLGSLTLNDIDVTLGDNSSYTLPCYIDYNGTRYQCRISSDATGLQIYRDGVWRTIGKFCRCSTRGTITNSNIDNWYKDTVPNYELDESLSAALFAEDLTTKFGTSIAGKWTGKTVTLNLASVSIKDTKSAWETLKKNMGDCFPSDSVEKIRYYYNVAIPSGEVVTKIELSYHNGVGMCTVHFYTEG